MAFRSPKDLPKRNKLFGQISSSDANPDPTFYFNLRPDSNLNPLTLTPNLALTLAQTLALTPTHIPSQGHVESLTLAQTLALTPTLIPP